MSFHERLKGFPEGAWESEFCGRRYLVRKQTLLGGRLIKLYAEELGGRDFVSLNCYETRSGVLLKPCEMPEAKVIAFIEGAAYPAGGL